MVVNRSFLSHIGLVVVFVGLACESLFSWLVLSFADFFCVSAYAEDDADVETAEYD
jgi:hypothetical protein